MTPSNPLPSMPDKQNEQEFRRIMRDREICHPFTIMRFEARGWVRSNRKANAFCGSPIAHEVTPAGMEVLRAL